jgi:hypothetical protein
LLLLRSHEPHARSLLSLDDVVRQGFTINGLPLELGGDGAAISEGEPPEKVEDHYRSSVLGYQYLSVPSLLDGDFERTLKRCA